MKEEIIENTIRLVGEKNKKGEEIYDVADVVLNDMIYDELKSIELSDKLKQKVKELMNEA